MTNAEMKPGRFAKAMKFKKIYAFIVRAIASGARIQITTYTQSRIYTSVSQFKLTMKGIYAQRGKNWDCIEFCNIRAVN